MQAEKKKQGAKEERKRGLREEKQGEKEKRVTLWVAVVSLGGRKV